MRFRAGSASCFLTTIEARFDFVATTRVNPGTPTLYTSGSAAVLHGGGIEVR